MPSYEVRQRRAQRANENRDGVEGGYNATNPQPVNTKSDFMSDESRELQQHPNPIVRFLDLYPGFFLVFLLLVFFIIYRITSWGGWISIEFTRCQIDTFIYQTSACRIQVVHDT